MIYQNMITPGSAQTQQTVSAGLAGRPRHQVPSASEVVMTQGDFNQTGNTLDLAIQGAGFFQVSMPDGTIAYTRAGNFHMNNQGTITTADGDTRPARDHDPLQRDLRHHLSVRRRNGDASRPDQRRAARNDATRDLRQSRRPQLNRKQSLEQTASSGNPITDAPGGTSGMGTLQQGYLENSNVDVVAEFVQMILAQRAYESNSKVIHVADDMYSQINNMIR